ncbi:MAG TPA: hypothetical protein VHF22_07630, partial [Planctomycetota bacterium]|nr:hypothetical protein [Planctomycetota bacterium]
DGRPGPRPSFEERVALIRRHWELLLEQDDEARAAVRFRRAAMYYGRPLGCGKRYRQRVTAVSARADVEALLEDLLARRLQVRRFADLAEQERVPVPSGPIGHW